MADFTPHPALFASHFTTPFAFPHQIGLSWAGEHTFPAHVWERPGSSNRWPARGVAEARGQGADRQIDFGHSRGNTPDRGGHQTGSRSPAASTSAIHTRCFADSYVANLNFLSGDGEMFIGGECCKVPMGNHDEAVHWVFLS